MAWRPLRLALGCVLFSIAGCAVGNYADAGPGPVDANVVRDSGRRDAGPPRDGGSRDAALVDGGEDTDGGGPRDAGAPPDGGGVCTPNATNLVINEVMVRSVAGASDLGEWFEIHNRGACTVNLVGLIITSPIDAGGTNINHTMTSGSIVSGGYFVVAQSGAESENHALPHDYVYGDGTAGVVLNNGSDTLILSYGGIEIDRVRWAFTPVERISLQLDPDSVNADNGDLGSPVYCPSRSTQIYSSTAGGPYLGTPGGGNDDC